MQDNKKIIKEKYILNISNKIDGNIQFIINFLNEENEDKNIIGTNKCIINIKADDYKEIYKIVSDAWKNLMEINNKVTVEDEIEIIATTDEEFRISNEIKKIMNSVKIVDNRKKKEEIIEKPKVFTKEISLNQNTEINYKPNNIEMPDINEKKSKLPKIFFIISVLLILCSIILVILS